MSTVSDKRKLGFTIVENELIHNYSLTPFEGWLYVVLLSHANRQTQTAFPGYARLAKLSGMGRTAVRTTIESLVTKGLITKTTRFNGETFESNEYTFLSLKGMPPDDIPMPPHDIPYAATRHTPMSPHGIPMSPRVTEPESLTKVINQRGGTNAPTPPESQLEKIIRQRRAKP
jgi:DNA-binding MarR family transcriptional regulator